MEEVSVDCCIFSPGGDYLVVCGADSEVKIWDCSNKLLTQRFRPGDSQITCVSWSKTQNVHKRKRRKSSGSFVLLAVAMGNTIHIWNITKGEEEKTLSSDSSRLTCLEWGPNDLIYSGSSDHHVTEWNITTEQSNYTWKADRRSLQCMCCHDNGELLLTAGTSIKLWNLKDRTQIKKFTGHATIVKQLKFIEDTHFISCAENDRIINIWSKSSKTSFGTLTCEDDVIMFDTTTDQSKQVEKLVALSQEGIIHMFTFELTNQITAPITAQSSVQFVATATKDSTPSPLPVIATKLNQSLVGVAYGSILRPSLETIDFNQSKDRVCLFREAPTAGSLLLSATNEPTSDKSPVKKVTILGPGNMTVPLKKKSSSASTTGEATSIQDDEMTMGERLGHVDTPAKGKKQRPSAGQLSTLLSQAVANGNDKLLEDVLRFQDNKVVMATIRGIPIRDVLPFLRKLIELLQTSPARGLELSIWLKTVLEIHAIYLTSIPHVLDSFSGLYQLLDSRVNTFPKLCKLQGKLDLLVAQSSGAEDNATAKAFINTPLVTVTLGEDSDQQIDEDSSEDSTHNDDWDDSDSPSEDDESSSDVAMETDPSTLTN